MKDLDAIVSIDFNFTDYLEQTLDCINDALRSKNEEVENLRNIKQEELTEFNTLLLKANLYDIEKLNEIKSRLTEAYQLACKYDYMKGV